MGTTEKSKQMASKESLNNAVQTRPKATLYKKEDKKIFEHLIIFLNAIHPCTEQGRGHV